MASKPTFSFSPSGHDFQREAGRNVKRTKRPKQSSLFSHTNKTFISKPPEQPSTPATNLFGSVASFTGTFSVSSLEGTPISNPFAAANQPSSSALSPLGSKKLKDYSSDSESGSSSASSRSQSTESLASTMAGLKFSDASPKSKPGTENRRVTPSSANPDSSTQDVDDTDQTDAESADESGYESSQNGVSNHESSILASHLSLLDRRPELDELNEIKTTPIFTEAVRKYALSLAGKDGEKPFSQYGLLAGQFSGGADDDSSDPRIFWNIAAPSSFFICGSQGSGKSHTLSCVLENALAACKANVLPRPLTGLVFHYDTFISDSGGSPCEVAWLSSNRDIKVRVLCSPTNIRTIQRLYKRFPNIEVKELRLNESDLNTKRMLDLMAVTTGGNLPLYLHVAQRILRDMRADQQRTGSGFSYSEFKRRLHLENLTEMQLSPLKQRLETLESFMVESQAKAYNMFKPSQARAKPTPASTGTSWVPQSNLLTVVDLSCPCVTPEMACSLFNICLSLFLEQDSATVGRIVALDEAHKYMTDSQECQALTEALLATIRLQRHLGARVVISTQEPTISPKLLDLCSVTIVHRFTSPDWLGALRRHLAGVSTGGKLLEKAERLKSMANGDDHCEDGELEIEGLGALTLGDADPSLELFSRIVDLRVGEALMFAPSAIIGVKRRRDGEGKEKVDVKRLAHGVLKIRIRNRTTADGGRSIMAA